MLKYLWLKKPLRPCLHRSDWWWKSYQMSRSASVKLTLEQPGQYGSTKLCSDHSSRQTSSCSGERNSQWQRMFWDNDSSDFHLCKWIICSNLLLSSHFCSVLQWMWYSINPANIKPALKITVFRRKRYFLLSGWAKLFPSISSLDQSSH